MYHLNLTFVSSLSSKSVLLSNLCCHHIFIDYHLKVTVIWCQIVSTGHMTKWRQMTSYDVRSDHVIYSKPGHLPSLYIHQLVRESLCTTCDFLSNSSSFAISIVVVFSVMPALTNPFMVSALITVHAFNINSHKPLYESLLEPHQCRNA